MNEKLFNIVAARELAKPQHILTSEIIGMYDSQIKFAIENGRRSIRLRFQLSQNNGHKEMTGFPPGMSPSRGLEMLRDHYTKQGFTASDPNRYSGSQRDLTDYSYSYIEVSGWAP